MTISMSKAARNPDYASLNPQTKEYSFYGPLGTSAITIIAPIATYLLYFACPNSTDEGTCRLIQKPQLDNVVSLSFLQSLFKVEAFVVYLAWYAFTVIAWAIIPSIWVKGTPLRDGNHKMYKMNATGLAIIQIIKSGPHGFTYLADNWIPLLTSSLIMSTAQAIYLYAISFKGDRLLALGGNTGNLIHDKFFLGRELNPSIGSFDIKTFSELSTYYYLNEAYFYSDELRPGLILWWLIDMSLVCKQYTNYGRISDSMLLVIGFQGWYVFDALYCESSILTQMDIVVDGFGFMLARFLANHPNDLGMVGVFCIVALQLLGYYIFRVSNAEKNEFRTGNNPKNLQFLQTKRGTKLLISGWWGFLRHPNYLGDWIMALAWTLPAGFLTPLVYFYPVYFLILLIHRSIRDDAHCREKYGDDWERYLEKVPYCIFPYSEYIANTGETRLMRLVY
ncbi:hypothetical protein E3Q23_03440 [Wallemia mellicola]|uniref:ERG4/ERG24 ergosterol biosynthesis protein n=1 Tax=Wallemia mellicola TaxID=1708541 RepID=A0A4T0QNZ6_9BASI|nr:hypothetical protein E3Q23_03440 [Wallemia mellicola]TIB87902.1 ERG4/ERG24 ergosterol biosynthesis protein [Wallemia mellicola]TIC25608.1 ERG4/ERG24 ergosterol biosynthesis protein [Wallemia mellicola]TIC27884.1 ERG4/ERG24 ergosterol biosynthesis protein [Wallemia mellicola]TIC73073.1 ERG4/ERG24 ergosterol biosynthesis protein [Wallemia mellicola]